MLNSYEKRGKDNIKAPEMKKDKVKQCFNKSQCKVDKAPDVNQILANRYSLLPVEESTDIYIDDELNGNPFKPSFYHENFVIGKVREKVLIDFSCKEHDLFELELNSKYVALFMMTVMVLYFGYNIPVDTVVNYVYLIVTSARELFEAGVDFVFFSETSWVVNLPAFLALLAHKYKRKVSPIHSLMLLSLGSHSVYKTVSYVTKQPFEPCPLPQWLQQVNSIPLHVEANPMTFQVTQNRSLFFVPGSMIKPKHLTCENIKSLNNALKLAPKAADQVDQLEGCGFIDDERFSNMCYQHKEWHLHKKMKELSANEEERCKNKNYCVSARPVLLRSPDYSTAGYDYQTCCLMQGECRLPDNYSDFKSSPKQTINFGLVGHRGKFYDIYMYEPTLTGGQQQKILTIEAGVKQSISGFPLKGIFSIYEAGTKVLVGVMCFDNNSASMYNFME